MDMYAILYDVLLIALLTRPSGGLQEARAAKDKKKAEKAKKRRSFFSRGKTEDEEEDDQEDYEEVHSLQLSDKRLEATRRETDQVS